MFPRIYVISERLSLYEIIFLDLKPINFFFRIYNTNRIAFSKIIYIYV